MQEGRGRVEHQRERKRPLLTAKYLENNIRVNPNLAQAERPGRSPNQLMDCDSSGLPLSLAVRLGPVLVCPVLCVCRRCGACRCMRVCEGGGGGGGGIGRGGLFESGTLYVITLVVASDGGGKPAALLGVVCGDESQ